jgi:endonuclease I
MKKLALLYLYLSIFLGSFSTQGQIPPGYYNPAGGLSGAALKTALNGIIKGHTRYTYDYLWDSFSATDKKPNLKVWDFYSDIPDGTTNGNPPYVFTFDTSQCATTPGYEGACYNREHSFPKSWFGASESDTMYTDMFHLYPTDSYVNTRRNNYPYGEVAVPTWVSQNGSKRGLCAVPGYSGNAFEPRDDFKGDLARTYFYMATRYENRIAAWQTLDPYGDVVLNGTSYPCFEPWFLTMLLAWNAADPVSQKEMDRNNIIYTTYQHNRNPFIDHPEYAQAIWVYNPISFPEPSNYPSDFSSHNIHLQWADATGTDLPESYLIRMSDIGFNAIQTPVDGIQVTNSAFDKNVLFGLREVWFTNLNSNTSYYFKIYSNSGTGVEINYKTDGTIPQILQKTSH